MAMILGTTTGSDEVYRPSGTGFRMIAASISCASACPVWAAAVGEARQDVFSLAWSLPLARHVGFEVGARFVAQAGSIPRAH